MNPKQIQEALQGILTATCRSEFTTEDKVQIRKLLQLLELVLLTPSNAHARAKEYARLQKAAYESNLARYKTDVLYKNLFPYL